MRFSYAESMIDPTFYGPLARAAEEAGYDSMVIPDSICYPKESDSTYPYNPDGTREFLEGKPFIDPFVLMASLAAQTERLRFSTFVLKLPVRAPVLVAKQATSLAVLSNNRLWLGVGVSPWEEDFDVTGVPYARRGKRTDEAIDIVRGLGSGEYFEYHGEIYDIPALKLSPVPSEPIPILVGGHSDAALRRAAQRGDGWMHAGGGPEDLPEMMARLAELRRQAGRDHLPFELHVVSLDGYSPDGVARLEEQGVTDLIIGFRWAYDVGPDTEVLQTKLDNLRRFADDVIAKVRS